MATPSAPDQVNAIDSSDGAVRAMCARLAPVGEEVVPLSDAAGRVTAHPIVADRPSPPSDVSAMDGYAVRLSDLPGRDLEVAATVLPGRPVGSMPRGAAVRIMTGAVVPAGAEAIIRREDVTELPDRVVLPEGLGLQPGQNIRRRGENLQAGGIVVERGAAIGPAVAAALASFGAANVPVYARVRIAVVTTGDELLPPGSPAEPWQIHDSNGPALRAMLATCPWVEMADVVRVADERHALLERVRDRLRACDVLLLTGGVSAGTHDFVPEALREAGCDVVFHRLPLRPGHPVLGAVGPEGQAVLGLPGNPQSVMTTARRIGAAVLRRRAGFAAPVERRPAVSLRRTDGRSLRLWWYRPVRLTDNGGAELVESRGSGDVVAAARSDGFVEVPPGTSGDAMGPWPFYGWSLAT